MVGLQSTDDELNTKAFEVPSEQCSTTGADQVKHRNRVTIRDDDRCAGAAGVR